MIDIFLQKDLINLLKNKNVVLIGDSNIRNLYKDFLALSKQSSFVSLQILKKKMEESCYGDKLLTHGPKYNGREYREEREAKFNGMNFSFYFITCVYDKYVKEVLRYISRKSKMPDVLIINSCLWDVTRWGPAGVDLFRKNLKSLMKELKKLMPDSLVIWLTTPPIACEVKGAFLVKELDFLRYSVRFHVMEANHYARKVVVDHGFDVVDCHYHLKMQIHRRQDDGVHWHPPAMRYITNLLLTHISLAWNVALPHRYKSNVMEDNLNVTKEDTKIVSITPKKKIQKIEFDLEKKENLVSPKLSKKHRNKRKSNGQESPHGYLKRMDIKKRHKRIQRWDIPPGNYFENSVPCSYNNTEYYNQNDSGYFPSPNLTSVPPSFLCTVQRQVSIPNRMPLLSDPYPYSMYSPQTSVAPNMHSSRQVIFASAPNWQPYRYPNINEPHFRPEINFSSLDSMPFGIQF